MSVNVADGRRHRGSGLPKYFTIKAVAEALDVSLRTIRRTSFGRRLLNFDPITVYNAARGCAHAMMGGRCHATPPAHRVADIALSATNTMPGVVVPPCAVFQFQCSPPKQAFITSDPETQKR